MKRAAVWLAVLIAVLAFAVGVVFYVAFGKNRPIVDGQTLGPGVQTVKDGFVSIFVLDAGPGKVALVDCGKDKAGEAILKALQNRGLSPASVSAIFITHGHGDHVAGCNLFKDAAVYGFAEDSPLMGENAKLTHPLKDGEAVDVGTLHVEAFATPGHTPGSAVYLADGVLFLGDSAGGAKDGTLMPAVTLFSSNPSQNRASLKALAARLGPRAKEVRVLAFAHSGPLDGLSPLQRFAATAE